MYCKNCGSKLNEGAVFCTNCGSSIDGVISSSQNNNATTNNGGSIVKTAIKMFLKLIGISILVFFAMFMVKLILILVGVEMNDFIKGIIEIIQITIPSLVCAFALPIAIVYALIKNS